jgi:ribosome recycling factor
MIEQTLNTAREKMKKALDVTRTDLTSIRSGRATPALVENIIVMAYGGTQRLRVQEMGTITTLDSKTVVITPYDPSTIAEIEKGILAGSSGLTPVVDRDIIRITIPLLSEERRMEYVKLAKAKLEAGKVMIRQIRGDAMKELKKLDNEDEEKHGERMIQELTDEMVAEIDTMGAKKEQELLQV